MGLSLIVVGLFLALGAPAHAGLLGTNYGSLSGRVTNSSGEGVPWVCVELYDAGEGYWVNETETSQYGGYVFSSLQPGDYKVAFTPGCYDGETNYLSEWYSDKADFESADAVSVQAGSETRGIDAELARGGSISGTVKNEAGVGLGGMCVDAVDGSNNWAAFGYSDSNGAYSVVGLRTADYRIQFVD